MLAALRPTTWPAARDLVAPLGALVCAMAMWYYVLGILIPQQVTTAATQNTPRGNLSDLYPRWYAAHELLLHGRDPYSAAVTREIQVGYYGRALDPTQAGDPQDQQAFAYPVYVVFLLWPVLGLPFAAVQEGFTWLLLALTAASVPLWAAALGRRLTAPAALAAILLTLGSYQAIQGMLLQQLTLLVAVLLAGSLAALVGGRTVLAGILLALATIKPQLAAPLLAWLALWTASDWRRRQGLAWGFGGTLLLLLAGAAVVQPDWIGRFWTALGAYQQYHGESSIITTLLTPFGDTVATVGAGLVAAGLGLAVARVAWRARRAAAGTPAFGLVLSLVLATTLVLIPTRSPYNQVLLLPALLLLAGAGRQVSAAGRPARWSVFVGWALVAWPWAAALMLAGLALVQSPAGVQRLATLPFLPIVLISLVFIPLGVLLALAGAAGPWLRARAEVPG